MNSDTPRVDAWCELAMTADISAVLEMARELERELGDAKESSSVANQIRFAAEKDRDFMQQKVLKSEDGLNQWRKCAEALRVAVQSWHHYGDFREDCPACVALAEFNRLKSC